MSKFGKQIIASAKEGVQIVRAQFAKAGVDTDKVTLDAACQTFLTNANGDHKKAAMALGAKVTRSWMLIICEHYLRTGGFWSVDTSKGHAEGSQSKGSDDGFRKRDTLPSLAPITPDSDEKTVPVINHFRAPPGFAVPEKPVLKRKQSPGIVVLEGVFDRIKTSNGTPWSKVHWHELDGMGIDGRMVEWIRSNIAAPTTNKPMLLKDMMTETQFIAARKYGCNS